MVRVKGILSCDVAKSLVQQFTVLWLFLPFTTSLFDPSERLRFPSLYSAQVRSCDEGKLTVRIHNATDGGIVYVRGSKSACLHFTADTPRDYTFDITDCKLDWNGQFKLVIQKKALYQTSGDRVITVRCIVETDDIVVNGKINVREEIADDAEVEAKPMASMRLYHNSEDVTGSDVTLDDTINLHIDLNDDYKGVVDISAKECYAADIPIIASGCTIDQELFPNFAHVVRGELTASFSAFRPTILTGGTFTLILSCTLNVCRGYCHSSSCLGKDRRVKRAAVVSENATDTIVVATVVRIMAQDNHLQRDFGFCTSASVLYSIVATISVAFLALIAIAVRFLWKYVATRGTQLVNSTPNNVSSIPIEKSVNTASFDPSRLLSIKKGNNRTSCDSRFMRRDAKTGTKNLSVVRHMGSIVAVILEKNVATAMETLQKQSKRV